MLDIRKNTILVDLVIVRIQYWFILLTHNFPRRLRVLRTTVNMIVVKDRTFPYKIITNLAANRK